MCSSISPAGPTHGSSLGLLTLHCDQDLHEEEQEQPNVDSNFLYILYN